MKCWPVPESYSDDLPKAGESGSFWEERNDRHNCGIDLYAPAGAEVLSIEGGKIIETGVFADMLRENYFNLTYYVVIKSEEKLNYKYAGLSQICVETGESIGSGSCLGLLGNLINRDRVTDKDPFHIREMIYKNMTSLLHIEIYKSPITEVKPYSCGNLVGTDSKPASLLDPANVLLGLRKEMNF